MNWNQFCKRAFHIAPTFSILHSRSSITARRTYIRDNDAQQKIYINRIPTGILQLPSQKSVIQYWFSESCPSSLIDLNVVDLIAAYNSSNITLNNCPYLWYNEQRYEVLKQEENEYDHIQIILCDYNHIYDSTLIFMIS